MGDDDEPSAPSVIIKCVYQHDATEIEIDEMFPFQDLERMLKEEFAAFGDVIIKYKDLEGDMVRLSARNLAKVVATFLKTESKKINMTMENEDDLEEQALQDEARVAALDKELDQGIFDRKKLYVWGDGSRAQLCRANLQGATLPAEAELLTPMFPKTMAAGAYHSVLITDDQNIVVWGCGEEGQLGIANLELPNTRDALHTKTVRVLTPQVLPMLSKQFVRQVACGYSHSGALTEDGRVYTWGADAGGLETGFPMLGYGIPSEFTQANKSVTQSHTPQIVKSLESKFVMSLQCGGFHTACVDDAGEVFTWGLNDRGQLGHGDNLSRSQPEVVEALQGRNVVEVACGHIHTLALQSNRETFSWGANGAGQLGHGSKDDLLSPRTIKALLGDAVMVICAGPFHSAAINKICSVFTWGAGEWGRLGHGEAVDCTAPRLVEDLERKGIRSMSLGLYHTMALADNGDVYTWGRGDDGQLGHEDKTRMELKPRMVESLEGMEIRQVHCGYYHSYAMNADVFERPVAPAEKAAQEELDRKCSIM